MGFEPNAVFIGNTEMIRMQRAKPRAAHTFELQMPEPPHALAIAKVIDHPRRGGPERERANAEDRRCSGGHGDTMALPLGQQNACPTLM